MRLLLFSLLLFCLPQLLKHDFKIPPQMREIGFNSNWETGAPSEEILQVLCQPFTYLTHGNQSTVFVSQDEKYVLKLFRYTRSRFPLIQKIKCALAQWTNQKPKRDLYTKTTQTLDAAYLAYTEAQEFTQVLFCHLNLSEGKLPVVRLGKVRLNLDRYRFVLQKRAEPFKEALLKAKQDPQRMHHLIDSLVALIMERSALGIRNSDPNLGPNFGFLNDEAVEIDFGNYRKAPQQPQEIANYLLRLEHWLQQNAPEYIDYLHTKQYDSVSST